MNNPYLNKKVVWENVSVTIKAGTYVEVFKETTDEYGVIGRDWKSSGELATDKTLKGEVTFQRYKSRTNASIDVKSGKVVYSVREPIDTIRQSVTVMQGDKQLLLA
jgi:hypothetical protein